MQYKTIILGMLEDRPGLYERLRKEAALLSVMERLAGELKSAHGRFADDCRQRSPNSADVQVSSEAMELAMGKMEGALDALASPNDAATHDLDAAMSFICKHTPPE